MRNPVAEDDKPAASFVKKGLQLDTMANAVDVYINYLRKKIDQDFESKLIHSVRNVGYELGERGITG